MYLAGWKETLTIGLGYPWGYPDIRQVWEEKRPSAPPGGYPPADNRYPQPSLGETIFTSPLAPPVAGEFWAWGGKFGLPPRVEMVLYKLKIYISTS
jgi:hypothetical protein